MMVVGCDYYPGFQQIAYVDSETGELQERRLGHPEEIWRHGVAWPAGPGPPGGHQNVPPPLGMSLMPGTGILLGAAAILLCGKLWPFFKNFNSRQNFVHCLLW